MKTNLTIISTVFLISCSSPDYSTVTTSKDTATATTPNSKDITVSTAETKLCNINYDTISSDNYKFHKMVLDILTGKSEKKELDDQAVAMFMSSLNPKEENYYRLVTNKVIYSILENKPSKFAYCYNPSLLTNGRYEYFLDNLEHPKCNTLTLAKIIEKFETEFPTNDKNDQEKKKAILTSLKKAL